MMILGWMELKEEDMPPEHLWLNDEGLADHFVRVKERWNRPAGMEGIDDQDTEMSQNELTKDLVRK